MSLSHEIQRWKQLREDLETVEGMDEKCLFDTIDGETKLTDILLQIDEEIQERENHAEAIAARIKQLQDRKARHEKAIETLRTVILRAMDSADIKKIEGACATLSVVNQVGALEIENEAEIPSEFFIPQDPKLDKKKLSAALQLGAVKGARLGNGRINLQIRRS